MENIYFTADTHFGDDNVRIYEDRPFSTIAEMDEKIIINWNNTVTDTDTIYLLGDVGNYDFDKMKSIITQLKGKKILLIGNHDQDRPDSFWFSCGFDSVIRTDGIIIDKWFVLSHEPPAYMSSKIPWVFIYGHVHSSEMYQTITGYSACVSTERWNYTPVSLNTIKEEIMKRR